MGKGVQGGGEEDVTRWGGVLARLKRPSRDKRPSIGGGGKSVRVQGSQEEQKRGLDLL